MLRHWWIPPIKNNLRNKILFVTPTFMEEICHVSISLENYVQKTSNRSNNNNNNKTAWNKVKSNLFPHKNLKQFIYLFDLLNFK